jgi:hypothetical protein
MWQSLSASRRVQSTLFFSQFNLLKRRMIKISTTMLSLIVLVYEALAVRLPFRGDTVYDVASFQTML